MNAMEPLLAMSIRQPWLDMILIGAKILELRTWNLSLRGQVALHAPQRIDFVNAYFYGYREPWLLPRGKVVALASIADVWELDEKSWTSTLAAHRQPLPYYGGAYAVQLTNVQRLDRPISCRGRQKVFHLPDSIASRVLAESGAPAPTVNR